MNQFQSVLVAPSILSADFSRLGAEIEDVEKAGCDIVHVDVMDGHFVPNLTIGPVVVKWARRATRLPLDVHLMIEEPIRYIDDFRTAGSDWITVHVEATERMDETLKAIRKSGAKVGMSLRPKTELSALEPYLGELDLVLVMSVEPGFGGQSFIPETMKKITALKQHPKFKGLVSVDGGINEQTAPKALAAGADILVAGTAVFGQSDRADAIRKLRMRE